MDIVSNSWWAIPATNPTTYSGGTVCMGLGQCRAEIRDGSGAILNPNPCGNGTNTVCCGFY